MESDCISSRSLLIFLLYRKLSTKNQYHSLRKGSGAGSSRVKILSPLSHTNKRVNMQNTLGSIHTKVSATYIVYRNFTLYGVNNKNADQTASLLFAYAIRQVFL